VKRGEEKCQVPRKGRKETAVLNYERARFVFEARRSEKKASIRLGGNISLNHTLRKKNSSSAVNNLSWALKRGQFDITLAPRKERGMKGRGGRGLGTYRKQFRFIALKTEDPFKPR